jgi:hypothetical protein
VSAGTPRRFTVGSLVRRAQSRGEWPGARRTFLEGLVGMAVWDGGRAREEDSAGGPRFGRGLGRDGGGMRPESRVRRGGWRCTGRDAGSDGPRPPDARWAEFRAGKETGAGSASSSGSLNVGMIGTGAAIVGFEINGGGGIALRSSSAFCRPGMPSGGGVSALSLTSVLDVNSKLGMGVVLSFVPSRLAMSFCSCPSLSSSPLRMDSCLRQMDDHVDGG